MKTRLLSFALILMLSAPFASAQSTDVAKISFGVLGGVNFQNLNGKDAAGDKLKNDMLIGYHAGVNVQIPIVPQFYFQPGLLYSLNGAKNSEGLVTYKIKLSYIEMPLSFVYKALLGNGHFFLGFGPYIGYAIGGKVVPESGSSVDVKFKNKLTAQELADENFYMKHLDVGANMFAGYELAGGLFFQFDTQFGLIKINPENQENSSDKTAWRNTGFGLSIGYRF
jgi:hypothetical protein